MRKYLAVVLCACALPAAAGEGAMSAAERAYMLEQLDATQKTVLSALQGVSEAQWRFKPAPNVWSVQECAEHIVLAESYILEGAQKILQTPAVPRPANSNAEFDRKFFAMIQDRSHKATAPEPIVPAGKFTSAQEAAKEFTARRAKTIAYVKETNDDLRAHVVNGPAGQMDSYQMLLLLASHSVRHTAQIREVQANPDYPKGSGH